MKCAEARTKLIPLLDGELTPAEEAQLQHHLTICVSCRQQYLALQTTIQMVRSTLHSRAEPLEAPATAWSHLEARLSQEIHAAPSEQDTHHLHLSSFLEILTNLLKGGSAMRRGKAWAALAVLMITIGVMISVPAVRAQVGGLLRWFRFEGPAGGGEVAVPGSVEFTPLRPTYLPAGFQAMAVGLNPEAASLSYWNAATQQILIIDETRMGRGQQNALPSGKRMKVNGQPAVLVTGLQRNISFVQLPPTPEATAQTSGEPEEPLAPVTVTGENIAVFDGKLLVWHADGMRIEMFSNLSEEEMIKVAESLAPAEEILDTPAP